MREHHSTQRRRILTLLTALTWMSSCQESAFNGGAKNGANAISAKGTPEAPPDLSAGGWIGSKAKDGFRKAFDEASVGATGGPGSGNGSGANGDSSKSLAEELLKGVDGVLWVPCGSDPSKPTEFTADFTGKKDTKVRLSGEFCPSGKIAKINILFVIDKSGSMEGLGEGPNDPTGDECGRLRSAKAITQKYAELKGVKIQAGVVNFATTARVSLPMGSLEDLKGNLDKDTFCGSETRANAATNYEDALTLARSTLDDVDGAKVIYFITDGSPTTSNRGSNPAEAPRAGLDAAETLRTMKDLTFYALFVGYNPGRIGGAVDPRGYLEKITGDPDTVRVTADAEELVKAADSLGVGTIKLSKKDTKVSLKNAQGEIPVSMSKLLLSPSKPGVYLWATDMLPLVGIKDQSVVNTVTVTSKTPDDEELKTVTKINFKQLD